MVTESQPTSPTSETAAPPAPTPPTAPPAAADEGEESGELQMHPVRLTAKNIKFIPGPVKDRMTVLRAWCKGHCKGQWQALGGGFDWLFTDPADAAAFTKAWNSRKSADKEETLTGVTDE